jgi:hypothetical protein
MLFVGEMMFILAGWLDDWLLIGALMFIKVLGVNDKFASWEFCCLLLA